MGMIGLFSGLNISATGLRAQRVRQNVIASNIANAETTRTEEGGPYKKQTVVLKADPIEFDRRIVYGPKRIDGATTQLEHIGIPQPEFPVRPDRIGSGVKVDSIEKDESAPKLIYDPSHPDANAQGYVALPNVNVVQEMVDMISATRSYEASATAFQSHKSMLMKALDL